MNGDPPQRLSKSEYIFRFKDNRVVELWDLGQQIAKDAPNENGVF